MSETMVHSWYKMKVTDESVIPFNRRTKTINELIAHLEVVSIISIALASYNFYCFFWAGLQCQKCFSRLKCYSTHTRYSSTSLQYQIIVVNAITRHSDQ